VSLFDQPGGFNLPYGMSGFVFAYFSGHLLLHPLVTPAIIQAMPSLFILGQ
jgi:hypothetical protein